MPRFIRNGINFFYRDDDDAHPLNTKEMPVPFVFQHGLGADGAQPFETFSRRTLDAGPHSVAIRRICLDCRLHGKTDSGKNGPSATDAEPDNSPINFKTLADDLTALLDHLVINKAVVGGISMGAAVALNFAVRYPERVSAVVLCRPAWFVGPAPLIIRRAFREIVSLLDQAKEKSLTSTIESAREMFITTELYKSIASESPEAADSLLKQFSSPHAVYRTRRLINLPEDSPVQSVEELRSIDVPVLITATKGDMLHPWEYAEKLAGKIERTKLVALPSNRTHRDLHYKRFQEAVKDFLTQLRQLQK